MGLHKRHEQMIKDLVGEMTLDEKISQTTYDSPAIDRLGIPKYNWWNEALHGVGRAGLATVFPQAIGLAATWNPELMQRVATAISDEARAKHHLAIGQGMRDMYTGLTFWSPNINILRDPRWGRSQETYGEDPYLTAVMGLAFVKGLQGDDPYFLKLVATPKHFAAHSGPELMRHEFDVIVDERTLRETYLFAFEAMVKEGNVASIMGAYNRVNGEPACASRTLLHKILRDEWGFTGYVVSDCGAIEDIYLHHKVVETPAAAAALAVSNGCDLNCGQVYPALKRAVAEGLITEELIDKAVERLLDVRFRLGMLDQGDNNPYTTIPVEVLNAPEHKALVLQAARESIVLLKNEDSFLPLSKGLKSIAVIGPNADNVSALLGNYNGTPKEFVTPVTGIRKKLGPKAQVFYAPGCAIEENLPLLDVVPSAHLRPTLSNGNTTGLACAYYSNLAFAGDEAFGRIDREIDFHWKDSGPISGRWGEQFSAKWEGYLCPPESGEYSLAVNGVSSYRFYLEDELVLESDFIHHPILTSRKFKFEKRKPYALRLEYANQSLDPQIQLLWTLPGRDLEAEAISAAEQADLVVAIMGLSPSVEREEIPGMEGVVSGGDRTSIDLPRNQEKLLRQVHKLGKPIVLVLLNGSAIATNWAASNVPAIVEAWYPGELGGAAIADVLFGDFNPAGRLPLTIYKSIDDIPPFEDYDMAGRTYRYFEGPALYPFGHGLSYTTFSLTEFSAEAEIAIGGELKISVDVTNTGDMKGDEVVQLYVRHKRDVTFPRRELKGFARATLEPGETKRMKFTLHSHQLGFYKNGSAYEVHPGNVDLMLGVSSESIAFRTSLKIVGEPRDVTTEKVFFSRVQIE